MLKEQKALLAQVRGAEQTARTLVGEGLKIGSIVQRLRAAGDELEARVRFIERQSRTKPASIPTPAPAPAPAPDKQTPPKQPKP